MSASNLWQDRVGDVWVEVPGGLVTLVVGNGVRFPYRLTKRLAELITDAGPVELLRPVEDDEDEVPTYVTRAELMEVVETLAVGGHDDVTALVWRLKARWGA